jgi:DNA-binding CsgD family transcriptional regulator
LYRVLALIAFLSLSGTAALAEVNRDKSRPRCFQLFLICAALKFFFDFCELSSPQPGLILFCSHLAYIFVAFLPVFWFLFAWHYGGGRGEGLGRIFLRLGLIPLATSIMAFTNDAHHLLWARYSIVSKGGMTVLVVDGYGPWFWVHCVYSYGLFVAGSFLVLREVFDNLSVYKRQASLVVVAATLPIVLNLAYVLRIFPAQDKDYSSFAIALSGILFSLSISRYRILELNPPPRQLIYESLDDGMIIIDAQDRIVDCNPVGLGFIGAVKAEKALGRVVWDACPALSREVIETAAASGGKLGIEVEREGEARSWSLAVKRIERGRGLPSWLCLVLAPSEAGPAGLPRPDPRPGSFDASCLSKREGEVVGLMLEGLSNKEIEARLFLSENTLKTHIRHIYRKAGVGTRKALLDLLRDS